MSFFLTGFFHQVHIQIFQKSFLIAGVCIGGRSECHHHVPGVDAAAGVVSPSTSSAPSSSGNLTTMPDKVRPSSSSVRAAAAREGLGDQQWPWSEFLADDAGVGTELRCAALLGSPNLARPA
ncbi:B-box zinc finger protein 20 [Panicum miliaceum]|uniref:B-box zinc finger protein 20 n=1 Tax=Panicum miliaceum TaxID=4540 RepID=A0A3L6RE96_PANMI|nr:B-box zinc finger protein 20 [Panicum miliaceum]